MARATCGLSVPESCAAKTSEKRVLRSRYASCWVDLHAPLRVLVGLRRQVAHGSTIAGYKRLSAALTGCVERGELKQSECSGALLAYGRPERLMGSRLAAVDLKAKDTSLLLLTGVSLDVVGAGLPGLTDAEGFVI